MINSVYNYVTTLSDDVSKSFFKILHKFTKNEANEVMTNFSLKIIQQPTK